MGLLYGDGKPELASATGNTELAGAKKEMNLVGLGVTSNKDKLSGQ
jgi:hypothetical protein